MSERATVEEVSQESLFAEEFALPEHKEIGTCQETLSFPTC